MPRGCGTGADGQGVVRTTAFRWFRGAYGVSPARFWAFVGLAMVFQTLAGLACIAVMRRLLPQAPTYLRWPTRGQGRVGLAFAVGVGMAATMRVYAFAFGLICVWLMERSRSLLAPMIAHGVGDALEVAAVMWLQVAWAAH